MDLVMFLAWLVAFVAVAGFLTGLFSARRAAALPGFGCASAAFTVGMGIAAAEGDRLTAVLSTGGAVTCAVLFGSAARHYTPEQPGYPVVSRIRDLSGHTISIESLDATAVHRRGLDEAPGTLAIVERRAGRFVDIHSTMPGEGAARVRAVSVAEAIGAEVVDARSSAVAR
ncbi:hypothetical protein [Actinomadura macra]|uniref:hypothetical protein n=1 Tax=Actinomadura macra TaxID=46164 RepID=UPI00083205B9|nr:hypothetical protein [Actinomadura macra]